MEAAMPMVEPDLEREAERLLGALSERNLDVRLLGGIGIRLAVGAGLHPSLTRPHNDIDLITTKRDGSAVEAALAELGWEPHREFNALNGARRLLFTDPATGHKIDAFVDNFEMCHRLPLVGRFAFSERTLSPADLLLTKLQIVELNAKDRGDCYALLFRFPAAADSRPEAIDVAWIAELAARDWGLHHTLEINLARLREGLDETELQSSARATIEATIGRIETAIDTAPKTRGWKLRARIGERKRWYEEPEEIG